MFPSEVQVEIEPLLGAEPPSVICLAQWSGQVMLSNGINIGVVINAAKDENPYDLL